MCRYNRGRKALITWHNYIAVMTVAWVERPSRSGQAHLLRTAIAADLSPPVPIAGIFAAARTFSLTPRLPPAKDGKADAGARRVPRLEKRGT